MATIQEIFGTLHIPDRLAIHMYRVAGVGLLVADHVLIKSEVDRTALSRVLLIHDVGNLVKMDDLSTEEIKHRDELVERFGTCDDHKLSSRVAEGLGFSSRELALLNAKVFVNNAAIVASDDLTLKIGAYADQRVTSEGLTSLLSRLLEAKDRYRDRPGTSMNREDTDSNIQFAVEIERQIFNQTDGLHPEDITNDSVAEYIQSLPSFDMDSL
jgi:hypothetical protein